jgi:20S proteasome alpha/beta subunit
MIGDMFAKTIAMIVLFLYGANGPVIGAQDETKINRGTVNIALANANGIVLLTDSVQSHKEADVWHHLQPVQKLFRLDDKTVCSIAGFASEGGWIPPQLNTEVSGIIN